MFDGNWYQGGCDDPTHGHPVPFTKEDHMRANLDLARRVHEKYPHVLIEMHDMMMGGSIRPAIRRCTTSMDCPAVTTLNWGFEQMWNPWRHHLGPQPGLYYYNLAATCRSTCTSI